MTTLSMVVTLTRRMRKTVTTDETTWAEDERRSVESHVTTIYTYRVTGAPAHELSSWARAVPRRMVVDGLTVEFVDGRCRHVSLQGRRLRKDGSAVTPLGDNSGTWDRPAFLARAPWVEPYLVVEPAP